MEQHKVSELKASELKGSLESSQLDGSGKQVFSLWNFPTKLSREKYYGDVLIELEPEEIQFLVTSAHAMVFDKEEVLIMNYKDITREIERRAKNLGLPTVSGFHQGANLIRKIPNYVAPRRPLTDDEWSEEELAGGETLRHLQQKERSRF